MKKYNSPLVEVFGDLNDTYCANSESSGFEHVDTTDDIIEDDQD